MKKPAYEIGQKVIRDSGYVNIEEIFVSANDLDTIIYEIYDFAGNFHLVYEDELRAKD